jgi:hypothetical protein
VHTNLLQHWCTPTCCSTGAHQLAAALVHTNLLQHWCTPTCCSTGAHQLAAALVHTNLLQHRCTSRDAAHVIGIISDAAACAVHIRFCRHVEQLLTARKA